MYIIDNKMEANKKTLRDFDTIFNGSCVNYPCPQCDRKNFERCVEKELRNKGHITGSRAHCKRYFDAQLGRE